MSVQPKPTARAMPARFWMPKYPARTPQLIPSGKSRAGSCKHREVPAHLQDTSSSSGLSDWARCCGKDAGVVKLVDALNCPRNHRRMLKTKKPVELTSRCGSYRGTVARASRLDKHMDSEQGPWALDRPSSHLCTRSMNCELQQYQSFL